ncbi:aromatic ring-hydroxylating dioxygenase subunit alpha [Rhizobium sp. TRM95111]|uniref:aromatic ring-hydroxylating oxygenase subunit alpha n=1 Tax=Rhizobium alarense TaxID=2846851 RepID=UPI001F3EB10C|nr:aromatic ring-hydroxylating dioxygenase subunit alpha [Rhizobium alarense]MCF3640568.1 aromatic ring-hydroxylating dioxygenase subunit alpha [Rhizobium alarense]
MNDAHHSQSSSPLLDHCPPSLPVEDYRDPAWHAAEERAIWRRHWIYVGRENALPPMTMRRISLAGQNLLLLRDGEGTVSAFHNTCRHRGAELCSVDEKKLRSRLIVCPYHQWSYSLTGDLVRTPFVSIPDDFRKEEHGLYHVPVQAWNGFLFVSLADAPPDFRDAPDLGDAALDNWPMADLVTGHVWVKELQCNWKIFWENYNECLHCPGIHPELSERVPVYARGYMAANEAPDWAPDTGQTLPALKAGARSWTVNGLACGPEFPDLSRAEREAGQTFVTLLPTMFIVAHVDYVRAVSLRPLGPERTELRAEWLFPAETLAAPGFDLANVVDFATLVMAQDGAACEMNQRGLQCDRFRQGTLMPQEFDVFRFQQWVRRQLPGGGMGQGSWVPVTHGDS